jgi:hypothetical protein
LQINLLAGMVGGSVIRNMIASGFGGWTANARALCQ